MQIVLIVLFAALLSPGLLVERAVFEPLTTPAGTLVGVGLVALVIPLIIGAGSWVSLRRLARPGGFAYAANLFGYVHTAMRVAVLLGFAFLTSQTGWLGMVQGLERKGWRVAGFPLVGELIVVAPVLLAIVLSFLVTYPTDRALRRASVADMPEDLTGRPIWTLGQYLDFQIRNQILTILVPMGLFIIAADVVADYRLRLIRWSDLVWLPEVILALTATAVFVLSPVMLRFIWRTRTLPASTLRSRLEETCRRMGLRYRDILIWRSHGAMVNAAVMGVLPHVRYVLLSDGLLDHLSREQVEAVFGHEAGHVKEHHIAYYMVFAIGSMVGVGLTGEWLVREVQVDPQTAELVVAGMVAFIWFVLFGWVSRRFERQADLYGVRCLDGAISPCRLPCWQHNITPEPGVGERICTTAADVFASALEAVASLNGISKYARGWRHGSIASRQEFVRQAAFYPRTLQRFERTIRRIKYGLVAVTFMLSLLAAWTYWPMLFPRKQPRFHRQQRPATWVMRHEPSRMSMAGCIEHRVGP